MNLRLVLAAVGAALLAGCGAADKVVGDKTVACDWTAVATPGAEHYRSCVQVSGPAAAVDSQTPRLDCVPTGGVLRSACPSTGAPALLGCCSNQQLGVAMATCYYDALVYVAMPAACPLLIVEGDPSVWTSTVPAR